MVYFFFYHEFKNKMKSKTNANQKQTYTHRKNSKQLISFQYSRKIAETDTLNAYTNNEKKLKSSVDSRSSCSTCDTGDVALVRNLMIRS